MKKIIFFFIVLGLSSSLYVVKAHAETRYIDLTGEYNNSGKYSLFIYSNNRWYCISINPTSTYIDINYNNNYLVLSNCNGMSILFSNRDTFDPEPPFEQGYIYNINVWYGVNEGSGKKYYFNNLEKIVKIYGNFNCSLDFYYNSINDYNNPSGPWYIEAWNVFQDYFSGEPFHWIKSLGDFWKNRYTDLRGFWNNLFHKDSNGDIQQDMTIISPTPIPPTPTPIQYSTFVEFDSNTGTYIYKYKYVDNSNNTIIATSPPEQPSSGSGNGENIKDDYYPSNPLDVPKDNGMWSPQFTINLGDGESLDIDLNTMNDTLIQGAEPYLDDIDASSDLFGAIPQDWFFLIGFCAIIPLICGIINRFLG